MAENRIDNTTVYSYLLICKNCGKTIESIDINKDAARLCPNCNGKFKIKVISAPDSKYSKSNPYPHK